MSGPSFLVMLSCCHVHTCRYLPPETTVTEMMGLIPEQVKKAMGELQQGEVRMCVCIRVCGHARMHRHKNTHTHTHTHKFWTVPCNHLCLLGTSSLSPLQHTHTHTSTYMSATWVWQGRTYGMGTRKAVLLGLARTVYMHRIWPYIWGVPCQKYRIYTVYIWYWPTLCVTWIRKRKRKEKEKEKLRRQWKPLPTLIKEKELLWYRVP